MDHRIDGENWSTDVDEAGRPRLTWSRDPRWSIVAVDAEKVPRRWMVRCAGSDLGERRSPIAAIALALELVASGA